MRVIIRHNILLPSGDLRFVACNVGLVTSLLRCERPVGADAGSEKMARLRWSTYHTLAPQFLASLA